MFERFTAASRSAVMAARGEAALLGHHYVGTEHLLLGLLTAQPGVSAAAATGAVTKVLTSAGIDAGFVRSEIVRLVGTGEGGLGQPEAEALHSIGIDLDVVRSRLEETFGEGILAQASGSPAGGRLPLTPRAKKVLGLSLREAHQLDDNYLGTQHLLLGLIREQDGIAGQILAGRVALADLRVRLLAELDQAA